MIQIKEHSGHVNSVRFAPDGNKIYSLGFSGELFRYQVPSWELDKKLEGHSQSVNCIVFLPDGRLLSAAKDGKLIFRDAEGEILEEVEGPFKKGIYFMKHLGEDRLLINAEGWEFQILDLNSKEIVQAEKQKGKRRSWLSASPSGELMAFSKFDGELLLKNSRDLSTVGSIKVSETTLLGTHFLSESSAFSLSYDGKLHGIDLKAQQSEKLLDLGKPDYYFPCLNADRSLLALNSSHRVRVFKTDGWACILDEKSPIKGNYGSSFSPDGKVLAWGCADKSFRVLELPSA